MGIPIFREPEEAPAVSAAEKLDLAASASRSSIRRIPTVRSYRERERAMRRAERESNPARTNDDTYIAYLYRVRQAERQNRPRLNRQGSSTNQPRDGNSPNAALDARRSQAGEEILRDALQHERPGERLRRRRQPGESSLRFEIGSVSLANETTSRQETSRAPIQSAPYSSEGSGIPPPPPLLRTPPLTVGFAPAFPVVDANGNRRPTPPENPPLGRSEPPRLPTSPGHTWTDSWPPLHRIRALDQPLRDGESSDSDMEGDHWETLLTTIEPDERLPSASSSFASASASSSTSRSEQSSRSTAPSSVDPQATINALVDSTYCPQSPSDSEDDLSGNDGRTPAPPRELIQAMNRRAEAAARSRNSHRNPRPSLLENWRVFHQSQPRPIVEGRSPTDRGDELFPSGQQRMIPNPFAQHSNQSSVHLPVVPGDDSRSSPRPVDGPVDALVDGPIDGPVDGPIGRLARHFLVHNHSPNISTSPLDDEINQEIQRIAELDRVRERFNFRNEHPDRAQQITATARNAARGESEMQAESGRGSQPPSDRTSEVAIDRDIFSPDRDIEANDLPLMRRVIQRMARREDIPDDWWAAVGLRRSFEV